MREILFRGKRIDNGEWVEGSLVHRTQFYGDPDDCYFILYDGEFHCDYYGSAEVDFKTVGQYTGLTDENGIEMYEGDIIHGAAHWLERYVPAVVTFRNGSFGLLWYRGEVEEFNPFTSMCNVEYTVVGNIYDNPELIKGGK